jgi:hypothetical protein
MPQPPDLIPSATAAPSPVPGGSGTVVSTQPDAGQPKFGPPAATGELGRLGPYRVVKQLGAGGMGAVYMALDTRLNRRLALKVMLPTFAANSAAKERFLREAKAVAQISHDNVVTVYEADERNGVPYIAMQFLQGMPLDEYLKNKGTPPLAHAVRVTREAALGLAAAHAVGLVHRDVKPGNLWLEAPNGRVKVLDFGLAKPVGTGADLTGTGMVVGTPAYMSPEQARGLKIDHRTDIFSLGVVLYRLLTGRNPFAGPNVMAVLMALGTEEPTPVRELNPNVPESLAALTHQMLAKKPDDRPASATAVADRLRGILDPPRADVSTPPPAVHAGPVVVLPMSISVAPGAFENLGADDTAVSARGPEPKPARAGGRGVGVQALAGVAALCAVLTAGVIVFKFADRGESASEAAPPDGSKGEGGKTAAPAPKKPAPAADPDRRAAEYVLYVGGALRVNDTERDIRAAADLPKGVFRLTGTNFEANGPLTDAGLSAFRDVKHLTSLNLSFTPITDAGLANFKDSKGLKHLNLNGTKVTDIGLANLKDCADLSSLYLGDTKVTDAGVLGFKSLSGVTRFSGANTGMTDAAMAAFKGCTAMDHFSVHGTRVTDAGLAVFEGTKTVVILNLSNTAVTDAGLATFRDCAGLEELVLNNCPQLTDAGLAQLRNCKRLVTLHVSGTSVSDTTLAALAQQTGLRELNISDTRATASGVEKLRKALPNCKVIWSAPKK